MRRIIHSVHEHVPPLRRLEHLLVDVWRCCRNYVPCPIQIRRRERTFRDGHARPMKFRPDLWSDDGYVRTVSEKSCELRCGNLSATDEKNSPTSQLQEDGIHTNPSLFYAVTP